MDETTYVSVRSRPRDYEIEPFGSRVLSLVFRFNIGIFLEGSFSVSLLSISIVVNPASRKLLEGFSLLITDVSQRRRKEVTTDTVRANNNQHKRFCHLLQDQS